VNVALFGGTFDPVHCGHLTAAEEAQRAFALGRIEFVPASHPPHKLDRPLAAFEHRYAMVALACAGKREFAASLLESPEESRGMPNFSLETVQRARRRLAASDKLYFLLGADAFLDLPHWHEWKALLDAVDFILVSRPGFPLAEIARVIPTELRAGPESASSIALRRSAVHLLTTVKADVSSSEIRRLVSEGKSLAGLVPDAVADYIEKQGLYRS
jgi:nicotinate-nucleotide adenylyltransferase